MPHLSIIIPVYNVAPYLARCLDSIVAQTFIDWEAICVDDGSDDGSEVILDEYSTSDKRFRVIHQSNSGVSAARQKGLELACGEYVGWVDPDDWVEPWFFEELYKKAFDSEADLIWSDVVEESPSGIKVVNQAGPTSAIELLQIIVMHKFRGSLWDKIWRRKTIIHLGAHFPSREECEIMEDNYFIYLFLLGNPTISHCSCAGYHYVIRENSLSNQGCSTKWWQQVINANNAIYLLLKGKIAEDCLNHRMALFKSSMLFDTRVTDNMFLNFFPGIHFLPKDIAAWHCRLLFYIAATGHRRFVINTQRLLQKIKKNLFLSI